MPIQDDIDDANLGRLEREAQRQKRAAQQAPTVQYMGTDGATGQVRVISGSGAAPVRVASHSNTQARPGDIKRGFAGGFDRGNVRRSEVIRPRRTKTGEVMVLFSVVNPQTNKRDLYVGGHVEDPIKLPVSFDVDDGFAGFLEAIGDSDYIVGYQNLTKETVGVIRSNGTSWEEPIPPWSGFLTYKGSGFFDSTSYPQAVYFLRPIEIIREAIVDSDDQYFPNNPPDFRTRTLERTSNRVNTTISGDPYGIFEPQVFEHDLTTIVTSGSGQYLFNPPQLYYSDTTTSYQYNASSKSNYIYSSQTGLNIVKGLYQFNTETNGEAHLFERRTPNLFIEPETRIRSGGSQISRIDERKSNIFLSFTVQKTYLIRETINTQITNGTVTEVRFLPTGGQTTTVPGSTTTDFNYTHEIYNGGLIFDSGNSYFYRIERGTKSNQFQNSPTLNYEYYLKYKNGEIQIPGASFTGGFASFTAMKYDSIVDPTGKPVIAEFEYYGGNIYQPDPDDPDADPFPPLSPLIAKITKRKLNSSLLWEVAETIEKPVFEIDAAADVYDLDYFLT